MTRRGTCRPRGVGVGRGATTVRQIGAQWLEGSFGEAATAQQALNIERMAYHSQYEKGELSDEGYARTGLIWSRLQASHAQEGSTARQRADQYRESFAELLRVGKVADDSLLIEDSIFARCFPYAVARRTFRKLSLAYEVRKAYLKAQDAVEHAFEDEMKQIAYDLKHGLASTRKTSRGRRSSLRPDLDLLSERSQAHGADEGLKEELELRRKCKKDCEEALTELRDENPGVTRAVETRYVANLVLRRQREIVDELLHHGELTTLDAVALKAQLNQVLKAQLTTLQTMTL